jgi:D-3-phosphoglycerate dehydrogenase / 2-oxoglutarate reductase
MTPRTPAQVRILICDDLHPDGIARLRELGFEPEERVGMSPEELLTAVPDVHGVMVRSASKINADVIAAAPNLEVVGRAGVGVDNVDVKAATQRGVVVMNTPTGNTVTTGELAISLLCSVARHIPRADRLTRSGTWKKKGLMGTEITGKTLGVIGLGRIGSVVAERGQGLRMNVIAHDPYLSATGASSPVDGVDLVDLDTLLAQADFISLHVPLLDSTRNIISKEAIAKMKPGARLINAARGGLVDEHALAEALESGHLAGAALDVMAEEPPAPDHPLLGREDVILTPHLGASSHEAQRKVAVDLADQFGTFFNDGVAHNAVNAPAVSATTLRSLGSYAALAESMGSFLAQRMTQPIEKIEFSVSGKVAEKDDGYLKLALITSVLGQSMDIGVNMVNAPLLAKERGLRVLEGGDEDALGFTSLLGVRVSSKNGEETHAVAGTVFGGQPRLVRVDGMHTDFAAEGHLLVTNHHDRPGVLGAIGAALGERGINIRRVDLGPARQSAEGLASAFLSLYDTASDEVLDLVRAIEPVVSAQRIEL